MLPHARLLSPAWPSMVGTVCTRSNQQQQSTIQSSQAEALELRCYTRLADRQDKFKALNHPRNNGSRRKDLPRAGTTNLMNRSINVSGAIPYMTHAATSPAASALQFSNTTCSLESMYTWNALLNGLLLPGPARAVLSRSCDPGRSACTSIQRLGVFRRIKDRLTCRYGVV